MPNIVREQWGEQVEAGGYTIVPFLAWQIASPATYLAVAECCYKYTWRGPTFTLNIADCARKLGQDRVVVYKHFKALEEQGLITMESAGHGNEVQVDMGGMVRVVNAMAEEQLQELVDLLTKSNSLPDTLLTKSNSQDAKLLLTVNSLLPKLNRIGTIYDKKNILFNNKRGEKKTDTPTAKARARASEQDEALAPYYTAYWQANGGTEGEPENLTPSTRRTIRPYLLEAKQAGIAAEDLQRLIAWRTSDEQWRPFHVGSDLRTIIGLHQGWVAKGRPQVWSKSNGNQPGRSPSQPVKRHTVPRPHDLPADFDPQKRGFITD